MTKRTKRIVIFSVLAVLLAAWLVCFIKVNTENPPIPLHIYYQGETFLTNGKAECTLLGCEIKNGDETKALLLETDKTGYKELVETKASEDIRMAVLTYRIKNQSGKRVEAAIAAVNHAMMTPVDDCGWPYTDVAEMLNKKAYGANANVLEPGEERVLQMAYFLEKSWMSESRWAQIETMPLQVIFDDYPVEYRFSTAKV